MARNTAKTRLLTAIGAMNSATVTALATAFEQLVDMSGGETLSDVQNSVVRSKRGEKTAAAPAKKVAAAKTAAPLTRAERRAARKAAAEAEAKPATRASRRAAKVEEAPAPTRRTRTAKAEVAEVAPTRRARAPKAEPFADTPTVDELFDFLDNFEGEPVAGGVRELATQITALGADPKHEMFEGEDREEKAENFGMFIAACNELKAKLAAHTAEELDEICEELDIDSERSTAKTALAIVVALNELSDEDAEDADEDDDVDGDDDADADDVEGDDDDADLDDDIDEEEVAPRKSRRAKKSSADELDELDD